jgi:hypothetical protein
MAAAEGALVKRSIPLALAMMALAANAFASPGDDAPRVEFPLGAYFRPGRPLDVRIVGGADRVRAPGAPWALPQGARGDEFLLQLTEATSGTLSLTIERDRRTSEVSVAIERLPAATRVTASHEAPARLRTDATPLLSQAEPPSVPDAWLIADADDESPAVRSLCLPALRGPIPEAFPAMEEIAAAAPHLPADVAIALEILAAVEMVLVLLLRFRNDGPWTRAAWLSAPPVLATLFVVGGARLPGAVRATAVDVRGSKCRTVFVRVEALRPGRARFVLPADAGNAWIVRFAPDDATVADMAAGREVEVTLGAGETRVFCYGMPRSTDPDDAAPRRPLPAAAGVWAAALGVTPADDLILAFDPAALPASPGTRVLGAASLRGEGPAPAK